MNSEALKALREKVEAGTARVSSDFEAAFPERHEHWDEDPAAHAVSAYLGSTDGALSLHEALLPGWGYELTHLPEAHLHPPKDKLAIGAIYADDTNGGELSRAWLLAILSALIAEGE